MNRPNLVLCFAVYSLLPGCAWVESSAVKPLATDHIGEVQAVTMRADRRVAFVDEDWAWREENRESPDAKAHHYCSEPSPDVSSDVIQRFLADIEAEKTPVEVKAQLANTLAQVTKSLFRRTQGVQLFRDGVFALCQAHHNGAVGDDDFNKYFGTLLSQSVLLVVLELEAQKVAPDSETESESIEEHLERLGALIKKADEISTLPIREEDPT